MERSFCFLILRLLGALAALTPVNAMAQNLVSVRPASSAGVAFARYIASAQEPNPFTHSGHVIVMIEASLPALYKESRLLALRRMDESEHAEYRLLQVD